MNAVDDFPFHRIRPIMLRIVIGALIAAAGIAIVAMISGSIDDTTWRLLGTAFLFIAFALFSWYDADVSARRSAGFALVSFAVSVYLFIVGMVKIWGPGAPDFEYYAFDGFPGWVALAFVARIALLHTHIVLNTAARFESAVIAVVTRVTLVLVTVLAVLLSAPALLPRTEFDETYWRIVGVIAILDALGTVLIPLGYALFVHTSTEPTTRPAGSAAFVPAAGRSVPGARASSSGAASVPPFQLPAAAFSKLGAPLMLQWPHYANGTPLPADTDGNPDFTGVLGYDDWKSRQQSPV